MLVYGSMVIRGVAGALKEFPGYSGDSVRQENSTKDTVRSKKADLIFITVNMKCKKYTFL
jgi:heterodisulfide reductase subunit A-like polyferredoxin